MVQTGGFYNMTYNPNNQGIPTLARAISRLSQNNTGNLILKATPVRLSSSGIAAVDVSVENSANAIAGLTRTNIPDTNSGEIINTGILEDVTTSATIGDIIYVSKTGGLTNIKPSIGINGFLVGDWVIRVGVVVKNNSNPLLKDILVDLQIVGEL